MTLKTILDAVCDEVGIARPASYVGSTDQNARQLVALANREGKILAGRYPWTALQAEHTFSLVASTAAYALPSDFDYVLNETLWDRTQYWKLRGPMSPQEWQLIKSGIVQTGPRKRWRVKGSSSTQFYVDPTPDDTDTLVFEYMSTNWCKSSGGTGQSAWAADTDLGILSEDQIAMGVKWRYLKAKGFDYAEEFRDYESEVEVAWARDGGAQVLPISPPTWPRLGENIPESGYGGP